MNIMLFLLVSLIVHAIPIPYTPGMLRINRLIKWLPFRLFWGLLSWLFICFFVAMTLPWALITLVMSFGILLLITSGFRPGDVEEMIQGLRLPFACLGFIMIILVPGFTGIITWTSDVANAQTVDELITVSEPPLFDNPIPDNQVRLVTDAYASFVARQQFASIGSNIEIAATHITTRNNRLVWVCVVVSTNVLSENFLKALIVVDANDPSMVEVIDFSEYDMEIQVGEGLFYDRNIQFGNYMEDMTNAYEYAYPTWDPLGELCYIQTRTNLGWDFVERPLGPKIYFENGSVVAYNTVEETPEWVTQAYSEEWFERQIYRWGGYQRSDGFDLFAGGFLWIIPPSNDRLEMTEDTRYILNPDTGLVEAFLAVHPPGESSSSLSLSGMVRGTKDQIFYYDLSDAGFSSGEAAINEVIKAFPDPNTGTYFGAMPLIYPVVIDSTRTEYAWYCPIYWWDGYYDSDAEEYYVSDIRLHALGMAYAKDVSTNFVLTRQGAVTGANLVKEVREGFVEEMGGVIEDTTDTFEITADVVGASSYVYDGDTHIVLETNNASYQYLEGSLAWMNQTDWYVLLGLEDGDNFTATVKFVGDQYRIVAITKN